MDLPTLLLSIAAVIAGLAAIPHGPTRRPAYSACAVLALTAVVVFSVRVGTGTSHAQTASTTSPTSSIMPAPTDPIMSTPSAALTPTTPSDSTTSAATSSSSTSASPTLTTPTTTSFESARPTPQKISLAQLCDSGGDAYICGASFGGSIQTGDRMFTYHGQNNGFAGTRPPNWGLVLSFPANSCTQMVMNFAIDGSNDTSHLEVVQTSMPPTTATAAAGKVGTLSTKLDGGPFRLQANADKGSQVFVDGYAICTTADAR